MIQILGLRLNFQLMKIKLPFLSFLSKMQY